MPTCLPTCLASSLSLCLALAACAESGDAYYAGVSAQSYPLADGQGEVMDPNEAEAARRISAIIEAHLTRLYPNGPVLRDAHPKSTGCVDAIFTVNSDIPQMFRRGIFVTPGRSYRAVVRFSNSDENAKRPDWESDGRGMAIKLFDLSADQKPITVDPLASEAPHAESSPAFPNNMALAGRPSQDFIMISHPTFLVADANGYRRALEYTHSDSLLAKVIQPFAALSGMGTAGIKSAAAITSLKIDNPLHTRYWSMVPYQLGSGPTAAAIKFSADFERLAGQAALPDKSDPNFLRQAMARTLRESDAKFVFTLQPRTSTNLSVEDSRIEWTEDVAPFYAVASIVIPKQTFDTPQRNAACELLSYSPWHALSDHKPLGAVNRMRKVIYETVSAFRRVNQR